MQKTIGTACEADGRVGQPSGPVAKGPDQAGAAHVENEGEDFVRDGIAMPPLRQLYRAVDATDDDSQAGKGEGPGEDPDRARGQGVDPCGGVEVGRRDRALEACGPSAEVELDPDGRVDDHRNKLEHDPGDHDVGAVAGGVNVVACTPSQRRMGQQCIE